MLERMEKPLYPLLYLLTGQLHPGLPQTVLH
jgi:hypothetical protein